MQPLHLPKEQLVARVERRSIGEELSEPARRVAEDLEQTVGGAAAHHFGLQLLRSAGEKAIERVPRDEATIEQRRQARAGARYAELGDHERNIRILFRQ